MKMRTAPAALGVLVAALVLTATGTAGAQSDAGGEPPRTAGGRPDLQGVWHFNTTTPLQRPERLGDQTHYTEEEHAALAARTAEFVRGTSRPPTAASAPTTSSGGTTAGR